MNHEIKIKDNIIELTGEGLLWLPAHKVLCGSDLHFEKGSFFSQFATLLPPYDSHDNLERLEKAIDKYQPKIFIALGDSFHDIFAADRMNGELLEKFNKLISKVADWRWIVGNHDPEISKQFKGVCYNETIIGEITFKHELDKTYSGIEISGHYHPKAGVTIKSNRITAPCFVVSGDKLIMPAFGKYTGGLSIDNMIKMGIIRADSNFYMAYKDGVYEI